MRLFPQEKVRAVHLPDYTCCENTLKGGRKIRSREHVHSRRNPGTELLVSFPAGKETHNEAAPITFDCENAPLARSRCATTAAASENGAECGVVRLFFRVGLVRPALLSMLPNVLAAGQCVPGSIFSNLALSFLAPHDGYLLRKARIAFSFAAGVEWEQPCGLRLRSSGPSGPTSL